MKIGGARAEAFSAMRKRALARAGAEATAHQAAPADKTAFLGLDETDLTPPVQSAIKTLLTEIDDLRGEVGRLKGRLAEVEALADRDVLTPLLNRRAFVRELHRVAAFAARYGSPASVVYFDLDGFKSVNDRFGHAAGDMALRAVADRLLANTRETDIVGRLGGDEFAVILVQTDLETANAKAERLKQVIQSTPVDLGDWSAPLRVSYGVRPVEGGADPETVLAEADARMFVRKRAGV
ncbi:GGDEF domain-containing protein [Caulobacter mirabilis]|uniref:diguanylate cyclase n=1 Tax=Caulobacter mirabilis TaxID=69666 RepID=A0A2D2ATQ8_9CAUL|nr:GGDEF domain-containing protein [Caulobacter mirabilis]ATQ41379.1 GGDEF domain-containing protein [Caulobacter mirabilis]